MFMPFEEIVCLNLKSSKGKTLLYLADHYTRLSASAFTASKNSQTIITSIVKTWISVFGSYKKFLTDNGGEFASPEFIKICDALELTVKATPYDSPWSPLLMIHPEAMVLSKDKIWFLQKCYTRSYKTHNQPSCGMLHE